MNKNSIFRLLIYPLSASLLLLLLVGVVTVNAAFPGVNGKIAFHSDRDSNQEIYVMNTDGSGQINLTNNPAGDSYPSWSPDGTKIAFVSDRDSNQEIYVMNADGSGQTRLTNNLIVDTSPSWSTDGLKIIFYRDQAFGISQIWMMNTDGTGETKLTNDSFINAAPVWSPDGTKIAFYKAVFGGDAEVYTMNTDGTGQTNLSSNSGQQDLDPDWSPDSSRLAFFRGGSGASEIWVMNADGSGQIKLTTNSFVGDSLPAWSADGAKIAFNSQRNGNSEIWVMNADGSGASNLSNHTASDSAPDWQPTRLLFNFSGFFQPVDNTPTLNSVKAGQAIPVKFSLDGNQGLDIFASGFPRSQQIDCDTSAVLDGIEETLTAGSSSLSYNPGYDTYTYVWKSDKAWANTCRQLDIKLSDGTSHQANFSFK